MQVTETEFAILAKEAGLMLAPSKLAELYAAYGLVEQFGERLRAMAQEAGADADISAAPISPE